MANTDESFKVFNNGIAIIALHFNREISIAVKEYHYQRLIINVAIASNSIIH